MTSTQPTQAKGLEGVVVANSSLSLVEGTEGRLSYRGYSIDDLATHSSFEEVVYLLWNGHLPTKAQFQDFEARLAEACPLPDGALRILHDLPHTGDPIDAMRTIVSALAMFDSGRSDLSAPAVEDMAICMISRMPVILTSYDRLRHGHEPIPPHPELGIAANLLYMLSGEKPSEAAAKAMDAYLILLAEHSLNASTFAARVAISTLSDNYAAITAALATLKGVLHGGANQKAMEMLQEIGEADNVPAFVDDAVAIKRRLMGMGHRIYKARDPRAAVLAVHSQRLVEATGEPRWHDVADRLDGISRTHNYFSERKLYPNVEFYSAPVLYMLGFAPDLMPAVFACSRVVGWTAHIIEQLADNRLIRPNADYIGPPPPQPWIPIEQRG